MTKAVSKMLATKRKESSDRFRARRKALLDKVVARRKDAAEKEAKRRCPKCHHPWHAGRVCHHHEHELGDDDRYYVTKTCMCGDVMTKYRLELVDASGKTVYVYDKPFDDREIANMAANAANDVIEKIAPAYAVRLFACHEEGERLQ